MPGIRGAVKEGRETTEATVIRKDKTEEKITLHIQGLTENEKQIILDGCLMNYYAERMKSND